MQLSFNKLRTFGECALKYRYAYVERLPRPPVKSLLFHRRLHAALARYHLLARRDGQVRLEELLGVYRELMQADRDPSVEQTKAYQEGEAVLRLYHQTESARERVPAYLEHKLRVPFGPYTLTGVVDRLDFADGGGYSLVDYKLDRELPEGNAADRSPQLSFYALLVFEGLGVLPDELRLHFLRHGVEHVSHRGRADLAATVGWVDEAAARMREERRWSPSEGEGCRTCAFWAHCPAKTGRPRPPAPVWQQGALDLG